MQVDLPTFQKRKEKNFSFFFQTIGCGNYGPAGSFPNFDFFHIPMASANIAGIFGPLFVATSNFCGGGLVLIQSSTVTSSFTMAANQITICSKYKKKNLFQ